MVSNRSYVFVLMLILLAFVPAILLRDFNAVNELNYLGIAQDALERGNFFTFYQDGLLYFDKPPIYLWLCMVGLYCFGPQYAMSFLLLVSVSALIFLIALFDRVLASDFTPQERILLMLGCGAVVFVDICALLGRKDMLFTVVMLFSYLKLIKRYSLIKTHKIFGRKKMSPRVSYGNLAIPLCLFLGVLIKGPYAFIMPMVALILVLWYNHDLKRFFAIFRPYYFLIILMCFGLWGLGVYLEGGSLYLRELFINQPVERFIGNIGHPRAFTFFVEYYPLLTLPIGLSALYFMGWHLYLGWQNHQERKKRQELEAKFAARLKKAAYERFQLEVESLNAEQLQMLYESMQMQDPRLKFKPLPPVLSLKQQATLFFFFTVFLVITIPASKLEIFLLPGILPLFYYVVLSYRQFHALHRGIDLRFEQNYLVVPISAFSRAQSQQQKEAALAQADFGPSSLGIASRCGTGSVGLVTGSAVKATDLVDSTANEAKAFDSNAHPDFNTMASRESNARSSTLLGSRADLASETEAKAVADATVPKAALNNSPVSTKPEFHFIDESEETDSDTASLASPASPVSSASPASSGTSITTAVGAAVATAVGTPLIAAAVAAPAVVKGGIIPKQGKRAQDGQDEQDEQDGDTASDFATVQATVQATAVDGTVVSTSTDAITDATAATVASNEATTTVTVPTLPQHQHWGLEIEDDGYMISGLKTRSERVPIPWLLSLSLLLPLLAYAALLVFELQYYESVPQLQTPMMGLAFGVLAFFSLVAIFFLVNRLYLFSLAVSGIATLGFVFCVGMAMPHLNDYFGVGSMVAQISTAVDQGAKADVCTFNYRNAYAMAIYDHRLHFMANTQGLRACVQNNNNIMFSPRAIHAYPQQAQYLQQLGAITVGNSLLLLSQVPKNTLSTSSPNSLDLERLVPLDPIDPISPMVLDSSTILKHSSVDSELPSSNTESEFEHDAAPVEGDKFDGRED